MERVSGIERFSECFEADSAVHQSLLSTPPQQFHREIDFDVGLNFISASMIQPLEQLIEALFKRNTADTFNRVPRIDKSNYKLQLMSHSLCRDNSYHFL